MTTPNTTATADERDRAQKALELRLAGGTWARIAAQLGYADESGARKAASALLDRVDHKLADEFRDLEGARLERLLLAVWKPALSGDLKAADTALRLIMARVKLYGLALPEKVELSTPVSHEEWAAQAAALMSEIGGMEPTPAIRAVAEPSDADDWADALVDRAIAEVARGDAEPSGD